VRCRYFLAAFAAVAGCSNLTEENGVAGLELRVPRPPVVEVGQTIQLSARALDLQGDSVAATIVWITPDTTVILTPTGQMTGRTGGTTARVQAHVGSIVSDFVTFTVNPAPDTLKLVGDSVLTVAPGVTASAPLLASLQSFVPAQALEGDVITFRIVEPVFADPTLRTVELPGGVLTLDATTGLDGTPTPSVTVNRVTGRASPDSAIVTASALTAAGATVPGSGQRFIVRFQ
jgi:hypothetical protein